MLLGRRRFVVGSLGAVACVLVSAGSRSALAVNDVSQAGHIGWRRLHGQDSEVDGPLVLAARACMLCRLDGGRRGPPLRAGYR